MKHLAKRFVQINKRRKNLGKWIAKFDSTNQKHYPDLGSARLSVWHFFVYSRHQTYCWGNSYNCTIEYRAMHVWESILALKWLVSKGSSFSVKGKRGSAAQRPTTRLEPSKNEEGIWFSGLMGWWPLHKDLLPSGPVFYSLDSPGNRQWNRKMSPAPPQTIWESGRVWAACKIIGVTLSDQTLFVCLLVCQLISLLHIHNKFEFFSLFI